jgi:hypothetical protein
MKLCGDGLRPSRGFSCVNHKRRLADNLVENFGGDNDGWLSALGRSRILTFELINHFQQSEVASHYSRLTTAALASAIRVETTTKNFMTMKGMIADVGGGKNGERAETGPAQSFIRNNLEYTCGATVGGDLRPVTHPWVRP